MNYNLKNLISDLEELKKNIEIDVPSLQNGYYLNKVDSILGQVEGFEKQMESKRDFLLAHQLETNMAKSHDWNVGYNHGLNKAIDLCKEILGDAEATP